MGENPFLHFDPALDDSQNSHVTMENITTRNISLPPSFPSTVSHLLTSLLEKDVHRRLGGARGDVNPLMTHSFFSGIIWCHIENKTHMPLPLLVDTTTLMTSASASSCMTFGGGGSSSSSSSSSNEGHYSSCAGMSNELLLAEAPRYTGYRQPEWHSLF